MKFSTRKDLESPIESVFDTLSNFPVFERAALRRGIKVAPSSDGDAKQRWELRFPLRGKIRTVEVALERFERPEALAFAGESKSFDIQLVLSLLALSRVRTRLGVELDVRPRSLSGRLLLQSMRLSKAGYSRRFEDAVQNFATKLEKNGFGPGA